MMMDLHNQDFLKNPKNKLTATQLFRLIVLVSLFILPFLSYSYINNLIFDIEKEISDIQKETSDLRESTTNLQVEYSQLLSPQEIEATALALGFTSANTEGILVLDDTSIHTSSNLYADLIKSNGERME